MNQTVEAPQIPVHLTEGAEVFVYGSEGGFGRIVAAPYRTPIEAVFGHPDDLYRVVDVKLEGGELIRRATLIVVDAEAARKALHVIDAQSQIVAGGPGADEDKLREIAAREGGQLIVGIPGAEH
jgi:hypothetical protein